ncbi:hypothetical protein DJ533_10505 [Acinetobacter defluvii]|uniref:Uncharacterized protein n=1 Tax=Acinetobacter defluvii TaxID=1871111 RepID=A0A2S2FDC7_9GAMM|nr:hypothetical protein [Acinetobacter defluvii]AWL28964.1 hypothetical protein DJ533_10505 [Acinetobacter defluvii]
MTMKQTQTKMFDFSDVGLDFCAGSKNLFPDRFKKMLALGYNTQTVSSVAVTGNQVVLTYGVNHGYVADRVLKLNAPNLNGEYVIDSVTTNTVTLTIDNPPADVAGGFTTFIASLGWQLVYEQAHIHIYKFKHIDNTDMYARLCFQNATTTGNRNCIAVGIGRTVDLSLGFITDENCLPDLSTCSTVADATSNIRWDFTASTASTFNSYSYTQGYSIFGQGKVIGSLYHIILLFRVASGSGLSAFCGLAPFYSVYQNINYPALLCTNNGASTTSASFQIGAGKIYIGKQSCVSAYAGATSLVYPTTTNSNSYLPSDIDDFNTTTSEPYRIYDEKSQQFLGCFIGGIYRVNYDSSNRPDINSLAESPIKTVDVDFNNIVYIQGISNTGSSSIPRHYVAVTVEEIRIGH